MIERKKEVKPYVPPIRKPNKEYIERSDCEYNFGSHVNVNVYNKRYRFELRFD